MALEALALDDSKPLREGVTMRKIEWYSLLLGLLVGAAVSGWLLVAYTETHPVEVFTWRRLDCDGPPPEGAPFVGAWIRSGKLDISVARRVDTRYFEYKDAPLASAAFFGYLPPSWWVECPGQALK